MADQGFILYPDFDLTRAEAKIRKLQRDYDNAKKDIENKEIELNLTSEKIEKTKKQISRIKSELEEISRVNRESFLSGTFIKQDEEAYVKKKTELEEQNRLLEKQLTTYRKQELSLEKQKSKTADIGDKIVANGKKQNKFSQAFEKSQKSADRFGKRLKSLIASALFFSVVTKAFTALRNEFGKLITETDTKTATLVAKLNGSLTVLGRTLYESARPFIEWILEKLIQIVNVITYGIAKMLGKSVKEMKKLAQQTKKAGKEAKGALASFDQINTLSQDSNGQNKDSGVGTNFDSISNGIENEIAYLTAIISGALLVLGVILTFTGANIPLGLGLIALGAVGLAASISANWNTMPNKTKETITGILGIGGALFILLGLALLLTGAGIPLGIGLILLGAGLLYGAVALSPGDSFLEKVENLWGNCKTITKKFITWFSENVLDGIFGTSFGDTLDGMYDDWCYLWEDLISFLSGSFTLDFKKAGKSLLNIFVDLLNLLIKTTSLPFTTFIGTISKFAGKIGKLFNKDWEFDISWTKPASIPRLATGAILPGGSPMLAYVNDQPKGQTYIEGSVENIAAAFEKYLSGKSFVGNTTDNRPIILQIDGREIARATRNGENSLGTQTVFGGFANAY